MSHESVGTPNLPNPPTDWNASFMRDYTRALTNWIIRTISPSDEEVSESGVRAVTADYTMGSRDGLVLADTTGGNIVITLPAPDTMAGFFIVKRVSGGVNTLTMVSPSGNIDNGASVDISVQYAAMQFRSDGTDYWIV